MLGVERDEFLDAGSCLRCERKTRWMNFVWRGDSFFPCCSNWSSICLCALKAKLHGANAFMQSFQMIDRPWVLRFKLYVIMLIES